MDTRTNLWLASAAAGIVDLVSLLGVLPTSTHLSLKYVQASNWLQICQLALQPPGPSFWLASTHQTHDVCKALIGLLQLLDSLWLGFSPVSVDLLRMQ
jgi:hypothetical protein